MKMMLIGLDEPRMKKDGWDVANFWKQIDDLFFKQNWTKEVQPDGKALYVGNPDSDNLLADVCIVYGSLVKSVGFGKYCTTWIEYDNDDDESLPFADVDFLAAEKKDRNPLFIGG